MSQRCARSRLRFARQLRLLVASSYKFRHGTNADMTTTDVVVLVPLVPAMPVLATWWLPWELWLPKYIPKKILGPYLLYASFAGWYFRMSWWVSVVVLIFGAMLSVVAIVDFIQEREEKGQ